jgi:hypothetical protein
LALTEGSLELEGLGDLAELELTEVLHDGSLRELHVLLLRGNSITTFKLTFNSYYLIYLEKDGNLLRRQRDLTRNLDQWCSI